MKFKMKHPPYNMQGISVIF